MGGRHKPPASVGSCVLCLCKEPTSVSQFEVPGTRPISLVAMDQLRVFMPAGPRGASTQPALPVKQVLPGTPQPQHGGPPGSPLQGAPPAQGLQTNMQAVFVQRCVQGQLQQLAPMPGSPQKPRWLEMPLGKDAKTSSPAPVRPSPNTVVKPTPPVLAGPVPEAMPIAGPLPDSGRASRSSLPLTDTFVKPSSPAPARSCEVAAKPGSACEAATDAAPVASAAELAPPSKPWADEACKSWATSTMHERDLDAQQDVTEARTASPDVAKTAARLLEVPGRDGKPLSLRQALADASQSPSCRTAGSDTSSIRDDQSVEEVCSRTPSPEPTRHSAKQQLAELLELWKTSRHESGPLSIEECECVENVFYDTMNPDRVKIVEMRRVVQPALLRRFCAEEQDSLERQARQLKTHKQFMLLHGTRWEHLNTSVALVLLMMFFIPAHCSY